MEFKIETDFDISDITKMFHDTAKESSETDKTFFGQIDHINRNEGDIFENCEKLDSDRISITPDVHYDPEEDKLSVWMYSIALKK